MMIQDRTSAAGRNIEQDAHLPAPDGEAYVDWLDGVLDRRLLEEGRDRRRLTVGILLWPSFPLMSLAGILESLRHAGDYGDHSEQRYVRWEVLGTPGVATRSSCGMPVAATHPYVHPGDLDYLFVIGGLLRDLEDGSDHHRAYLRAAHRAGCRVVGVCTGSFVLAQERILGSRVACLHPYHADDFRAAFPGHALTTTSDFEERDGVTTVPGGVSILSLMTRIVGDWFGPDRSAKTVFQLSLARRAGIGEMDRIGLSRHLAIRDPRIQEALVILDGRSTQDPSIRELAASLGMTGRHFLRLFRAEVGTSPKRYLIDAKLEAAIWMLRNTATSVTGIAYAAGFSGAGALSGHCVRRTGATPSAIRRSAGADIVDVGHPRP